MKKVLGWILAFLGAIAFSVTLSTIAGWKTFAIALGVTIAIAAFVILVTYLIDSD
jgi:hypothetical protein